MLTSDIDPFDEPHQRKVSTLEDIYQKYIYQKYIDGGYIYPRYDKASNRAKLDTSFSDIFIDCKRLGLSFDDFKKLLQPVQMTIFDFI
ncbi:TPA: hypothetical protein VBA15_001389 [Streptococcus agalactiae]|nr:hypothetical protein [Streptococcus agalactiae]